MQSEDTRSQLAEEKAQLEDVCNELKVRSLHTLIRESEDQRTELEKKLEDAVTACDNLQQQVNKLTSKWDAKFKQAEDIENEKKEISEGLKRKQRKLTKKRDQVQDNN
jgi:chromosome segregation ATPase